MEPSRRGPRWVRWGLALVLVATGCAGTSHGTAKPTTTSTVAPVVVPVAEIQRALDALISAQQAPGAVVGIRVRGGKPVYVASGIEPGTNRPLTTTDAFHIASLTKTFVGAEALKLVQAGKVHLDDHIGAFVADWPRGDEITLRQLLSHTSGIPPFGSDRGGPGPYSDVSFKLIVTDLHRRFTPPEVLAFARDRPLLFEPGTDTEYSNVNTVLLGEVIAKTTGLTLGQALHRDLLDPLHLTSARYAAEEAAHAIAGLTPVGDSMLNTSSYDNTSGFTISGAAGAMESNIPDLLLWAEALLRDRSVISGPLATRAFTIAPGGTGLGVLGFSPRNGFCVFGDEGCPNGVSFIAIGGSGSGGGTRSVLLYDKQIDTVIAFAMNREGTYGVEEFVSRVIDLIRQAEGGKPG